MHEIIATDVTGDAATSSVPKNVQARTFSIDNKNFAIAMGTARRIHHRPCHVEFAIP
jgi:hypothetical protein